MFWQLVAELSWVSCMSVSAS